MNSASGVPRCGPLSAALLHVAGVSVQRIALFRDVLDRAPMVAETRFGQDESSGVGQTSKNWQLQGRFPSIR